MTTIQSVIRSINRELVPQFEERLRQYLVQQDKEWLIEQIIRLSLDAHSLDELDRRVIQETIMHRRAERLGRVQRMALDETGLNTFMTEHEKLDR